MKRLSTLLLLTCFLAVQFVAAPSPTKRAIIIAIGDYDEATGWKDISSINDIPLIEGALSKQGFSDFIIKRNEEATKAGILQAFDEMKARSNPGDILVVHFSSHGQQIYDNNRDEIDGYDEAIVAYGAPAAYEEGYEGENHLRDEELGNKLDELRQQLGKDGDVLVIVDACHSGTATRGNAVARGGKKPLAPAGYKPNKSDEKEVGMFEKSSAASRGSASLAPMVVISAARADELNYEYNGSGSLSLALSRSFENLNNNFSYRTLFSKIAKEMSVLAPKQNPAIEGDVDRLLFGGKVVNQEPYYTIKNLDMDALTIEGGVYTGLNEGARIKLFEAGTISTKGKEPIAMGTVTFSEPFSCNAVLDKAIEGEAKDYWVFIDEMAFGNLTVSFNTSNIKNKALRNSLNNYISGFALAKVDDQGDYEVEVLDNQLRLVNKSNGDFLTYYDRSNTPVNLIPTNDGFRTFRSVVTNYAQGKFWKELEIDNYDYNIELSLIPIRERADGKVDTLSLAEISDEGGLPQFATDEKAVLRIQNNSSFAVYFNVLDIQPDGKVNLYLPQRNFPASELRIGPGERYEFRRNVVFYPPYGREVFKVLASFEPINLQPVFMTRGSGGTRGNLNNELEKLFADSYGTRGAGVGNFSGTDAATFSFVFEIVQPK
jgi:hypothetical protein